jgi:hypothetical protein
VNVIDSIFEWCQLTDVNEQLLWVYGFAGLGKSSIAASVCKRLDEQNTLAASFFCKRDDPKLRDAGCLLNTIVYGLANRHKPYGVAVAKAIQEDVQICGSHIQRRYASLVEGPLKVVQQAPSPDMALVVVIDALDECEGDESRGPLLSSLRNMCQLVPWLKIVITSRPDEDINGTYGEPNKFVSSRNIANDNASNDIILFVQARMASIAKTRGRSEWSEQVTRTLAERANGLFIWAETACRFIERGISADKRLKQVLQEVRPDKGTHPLAALDTLYATAIRHGIKDEGEDNLLIVQRCIGAVVATSSRTPLSMLGLGELLLEEVEPDALRYVIIALGSVLYEDGGPGGVVRVCHPSFNDYVTDLARSGEFYVDLGQQNTTLAGCCLRSMLEKLRFNICDLETSHVLNRDVIGLDARVQNAISEDLRYSCLYWTSHLVQAGTVAIVQEPLRQMLFGRELLYWMETMSLLGKLDMVLSSLIELTAYAQKSVSSIVVAIQYMS